MNKTLEPLNLLAFRNPKISWLNSTSSHHKQTKFYPNDIIALNTRRVGIYMKYFRVHMKDCAYITKQPRGIFTAVGRLVSSKTLTEEEEKEYWRNREYFERVLPVPPFYEKNNPDGAVTWFKDSAEAKDIWDQMTFYREMCNKYGIKLYVSECDEIPGVLIYEDAFQIAVKDQPEDAVIITREL